MRSTSPEMAALIASEVTTLCRLWTIERKDGTVFRFTDHDRFIDFDGNRYEAENAFMATAVQSVLNSASSDLDVSVLLAPGSLEYADMVAGLYDEAPVTLRLISYNNLDAGSIALFDGKVSTFTMPNQQTALLSLRGGLKRVTKNITERYSATCRAIFGDERCKFNVATVTTAFTVDTVAGVQQFTASELAASPVDHFILGVVEWLTGPNAGVKIEVAGNSAGMVTLMFKPPRQIEVGDTGTIQRGCTKTIDACTAYANTPNYRGEPYVPGDDGIGI